MKTSLALNFVITACFVYADTIKLAPPQDTSEEIESRAMVDSHCLLITVLANIERIAAGAEKSDEKKNLLLIHNEIAKLNTPNLLFCAIVVLNESYGDLSQTPHDRLIFAASDCARYQLARLRTAKAYKYFRALKPIYGSDGGESLIYKELEKEYFFDFDEE